MLLFGFALASTPPESLEMFDASDLQRGVDVIEGLERNDDPVIARVIGGTPVPVGRWQSTVSVQPIGCTGTLIAPSVVLTAAHCIDATQTTTVRTGSNNNTSGGQVISIASTNGHPGYLPNEYGNDVALLRLATPSTAPVTTIASDCILADYVDGAPIAIVGWGATDINASDYPNVMNEVMTTITDHDCSQDTIAGAATYCDPAVRPAHEMFAGGNGVDSCNGDSGGPIYFQGTDAVWYLAGVTSRGGQGPNYCGQGGVYSRPDAYLPWIESVVGPLPRPSCGQAPATLPPATPPATPPPSEPDPTPPPATEAPAPNDRPTLPPAPEPLVIQVQKNTFGLLVLPLPHEGDFTFSVREQPMPGAGEIQVDGTGQVFFWPERGFVGTAETTIEALDASSLLTSYTIEIRVTSGGGCDQSNGAPLSFGLFGLIVAFGRRRCAG